MTPSQQITLIATPSQVCNVQINGQACTINVYQKRTGLYLDLYVNGAPIVTGVLGLDRVAMVRGMAGFTGDLAFIDTQGADAPDYTGLGSRFLLVWGQ